MLDPAAIITAFLQLGVLVYAVRIEHRLTKLESRAQGRRSGPRDDIGD